MKRLAFALIAISLLASCEVNKPNGPKISEESLKYELYELSDLTATGMVRVVEYIIDDGEPYSSEGYSNPSGLKKVSDDRWEFYLGWRTGLYDFPKNHTAATPVVLQKQADDSWIASYHGDGMNLAAYKDFAFTTKLKRDGKAWWVNVDGVVIDEDDYRMDFGTDSLFFITENTDSLWEENYYGVRGDIFLYITQGNTYLHSIKATLTETSECSWYGGFGGYNTTWIYRELSKPDWLVVP